MIVEKKRDVVSVNETSAHDAVDEDDDVHDGATNTDVGQI